jgi:hypothetical protein
LFEIGWRGAQRYIDIEEVYRGRRPLTRAHRTPKDPRRFQRSRDAMTGSRIWGFLVNMRTHVRTRSIGHVRQSVGRHGEQVAGSRPLAHRYLDSGQSE